MVDVSLVCQECFADDRRGMTSFSCGHAAAPVWGVAVLADDERISWLVTGMTYDEAAGRADRIGQTS